MPQLKKISISRNNILPKLEYVGENIYTNYEIAHPDITTYLPIFSDTKSSSTGLSSEAEAESDGASSISCKPRKRQRLDHLSQEEKIMRRKMKNRVAAQTARDRKKARMVELEEQVLELETERKMLLLANMNLQTQNEALQKENEELKQRLGGAVQIKQENSVKQSEEVTPEAESRLSDNSRSIEHASFINVPLQKGQDLQLLTLWMMHFAYLPMIARLMIFMIYCNSILMAFSSLKTSIHLFQNFQTLEPLQRAKHQPLKWWGPHQKAWNPTKN